MPTHRPKIAKELALPTQTKIGLKKNSERFKKNINTPRHSPTNTVNERNLNLANDPTGPKYGEYYTSR